MLSEVSVPFVIGREAGVTTSTKEVAVTVVLGAPGWDLEVSRIAVPAAARTRLLSVVPVLEGRGSERSRLSRFQQWRACPCVGRSLRWGSGSCCRGRVESCRQVLPLCAQGCCRMLPFPLRHLRACCRPRSLPCSLQWVLGRVRGFSGIVVPAMEGTAVYSDVLPFFADVLSVVVSFVVGGFSAGPPSVGAQGLS